MARYCYGVLAAGCAVLAFASGLAAAASNSANRIEIRYQPTSESKLQPIVSYVKQAGALEKVQVLLNPMKLPHRLLIEMKGCNGESNAWYEDNVMTICYEFMDDIWKNVPQATTSAGVTPIDAMVGPYVDVVFHEFGTPFLRC